MAEKAKKTPSAPKKKTTKTSEAIKTASEDVEEIVRNDDIKKLEEEKRIAELENKIEILEKKEKIAAEKPPRPVQTVYTSNGGGTAKILAALFAVLFIGAAASAVYFYNEANLNADCETNYKGLLSDYTELSTLYNVLSSEKASLEQDVLDLTSQKASLSAQLDDMENSNADKNVQISVLEAQVEALDEDIDTKETRITYLEIMLESCRDRISVLEDNLDACQADQEECAETVLHPCLNSYWTSNPDTNPALIEFDEEGVAVEYFYIYMCVACTDCYYTCDPCDPCDPCGHDLCGTTCCCDEGPYDAIRLKVRVTTTYDETEEEYHQSIEVISWKWV